MEAIEIQDVRKTFANGARALQGVSLSIKRGEIFGVLGPNGAGKTTLLNLISTLLLPDQGDVWILGESVLRSPSKLRGKMNMCSGNANFAWSLTIRENLRFYAMLYGLRDPAREERLNELLSGFDLAPFADRRFDEVSTGTKQRLALAKALLNRPEILLLDEPTVGLDPDVARRVRELVQNYHRDSGATLVLTTHYMQEAEQLCERIAFIREGRILALGSPAELKSQLQASNMEEVFLELAR